MTGEGRVWELVARVARNITDGEGRFEHKALVEELEAHLDEEHLPAQVRTTTFRMLATSLAAGFVRRRNPKPKAQQSLYHDDAILPLGDGKRVWMRNATDDDLLAWARLSTENLARVALAEGSRQRYAADRIRAIREHPGMSLSEIEREYFDYVPDESDLDDGDDFDE